MGPTAAPGAHVPRRRIALFDSLRGLSVVSMVAFHYCYDLRYLAGASLPWFAPPLQDLWRCSISWTFLFVAGCMCSHSRSNLRRGLRYAAWALAIWVVTSIAAVDVPISFGIIYCMAACTLVAWALQGLGLAPRGWVAAVAMLVLFLALLGLPQGSVGIGGLRVAVPGVLYSTEWLSWLGFPGPHFASGDYYPLLPYLLMYLSGTAVGSWLEERGLPAWLESLDVAPLSLVGRHALPVYVVHQPLLLLLSGALG